MHTFGLSLNYNGRSTNEHFEDSQYQLRVQLNYGMDLRTRDRKKPSHEYLTDNVPPTPLSTGSLRSFRNELDRAVQHDGDHQRAGAAAGDLG